MEREVLVIALDGVFAVRGACGEGRVKPVSMDPAPRIRDVKTFTSSSLSLLFFLPDVLTQTFILCDVTARKSCRVLCITAVTHRHPDD